jgi:hypothetical protein
LRASGGKRSCLMVLVAAYLRPRVRHSLAWRKIYSAT